ncbi:MAG: hypothetical protein JXR25_10465 [Pontiellaceae bacterium]|nr:hypothetical protein [Pontiellaceae bacterium]MBN2785242.1 hypothetical protein [Pontiellaceae bacterium]
MKKWLLPLAAGMLLLAGCTTSSMKGTPLYSGEYETREGPASNRINAWPLVYYRKPALSILWPLMEFCPSYQAVRPIYSAYGTDTDQPVYNVAWPIGRFDPSGKNYRIFPVYWGEEFCNVVPLYWHEGHPVSGTGYDSLFPFWIWINRSYGNSLHLMWPFFAHHDYDTWSAWRCWPIYSRKDTETGYSQYIAWPLIHSYEDPESKGSWALPLYAHANADDRNTFLSLPYSFSRSTVSGEKSWDMALPLCYRSWEGERFGWAAFPALSWGSRDPYGSQLRYLLGLGGVSRSDNELRHHLFPLYYYGNDADERALYTLPWWWKTRADGSGFNAMFPLYYYGYGENKAAFYSLPWWMKKRADGSGWHALAPLYYRSYSEDESAFYSLPWLSKTRSDGSVWHGSFPLYYRGYSDEVSSFYSLPWMSQKKADGSGWNTTIPFYYHGYSTNSSAFYSPVWMSEHHADGTAWQASFPFYYGAESPDGSVMITPFYARKLHEDGTPAWRCYIPFVYVNDEYDAHFMTLLGGRWRLGEEQSWIALPLLSGGSKNEESGRNMYLAGLAARHWNPERSSSYVFPLYYRAPEDGRFVSVPYATWQHGSNQNHMVPPLLSGWQRNDESARAVIAAGLAGFRAGGSDPYSYVAPLYYASPANDTFISLPYSAWPNGDRTNHVIPPLLSGWQSGTNSTRAVLAAGLAGFRAGGDEPYHYVLPLYYTAPEQDNFFSIPYSSWSNGDRKNRMILPLLSRWYNDSDSSGATIALGLAGYRKGGAYSYHYALPLYYAAPENNTFFSLPYSTWTSSDRQQHALPLLLSGWSESPEFTDLLLLGGIGHWRTGASGVEGSHVLPFYAWAKDEYFYSAIYGTNRKKSYFATPLVGRYEAGSGKAGSWVFPLYWHRKDISSDAVRGYYFPLGYYNRSENRKSHGFMGIYDSTRTEYEWMSRSDDSKKYSEESRRFHYLLSFGQSDEHWRYELDDDGNRLERSVYTKDQGFFPLWNHEVRDYAPADNRLETSSLLGILYDTRHEEGTKDEEHDYFRRRILWRLYHYEKLNGDMSTDIFPGITIDSYKDGYYKMSVLWRLFRYEKDPETDRKKLDLLFLPLKR